MNAPAKRQRPAAWAGGVNEEEAVGRVPDEPDVRAVLESITEEQSMNIRVVGLSSCSPMAEGHGNSATAGCAQSSSLRHLGPG